MALPILKELKDSFEQSSRAIDQTAILLTITQSGTLILLTLILVVLLGILVAVNPDMQAEREQIVTPWTRWFLSSRTKGARTVDGQLPAGNKSEKKNDSKCRCADCR